MLNRSTPIVETALRGLHRRAIEDAAEIRDLLDRARRAGCAFYRGLNAGIDLEQAWLEELRGETLILHAPSFERFSRLELFLNFQYESLPYFFSTERAASFELDRTPDPASAGCSERASDRLVVRIPKAIYHVERRDRYRRSPDRSHGDPSRVSVRLGSGEYAAGLVEDVSGGGLGIVVPDRAPAANGRRGLDPHASMVVRFLDGNERGTEAKLQVRNRRPAASPKGWTRLGLIRGQEPAGEPIEVEERDAVLGPVRIESPETCPPKEARGSAARGPEGPRILRIPNSSGEEIAALLDTCGQAVGCPAVIVTNGWGQTKEALLPLARTLVATFAASDQPLNVIRFDGIRKRGESHNDPECRVPGREHHNFVFSQGVEDIEVIARFLRESAQFRASKVILVSFSAAAIEARKAIARDHGRMIDGWVSVVGSPDLQSMARSISGGVDFVGGYERGFRFGLQELLGVVIDIDRIASDAEANQGSFIEDSRSDLAEIRIPITWLHGRYDAWVDLERVRDVLSHGDTQNRRLIVIPTGHQLKTSRQAKEAFLCIAQEVAQMALGRLLTPQSPSPREVRRLWVAEQHRRPAVDSDLQSFWCDYLVGRDRSLGIELLTAGTAYQSMMEKQWRALELQAGQRIADLGSGTGMLALALARWPDRPEGIGICAFDYVREALQRGRDRLSRSTDNGDLAVLHVEADLDLLHAGRMIPARGEHFDAVMASLLLSYLEQPALVLAEIHRILKPGGRLVISSLCKDADISRLYVESYRELQMGSTGQDLGLEAADLSRVARNFLNDAAKILELEDAGAFHFWDPQDFADLAQRAGFEVIQTEECLGNPPQAVLLVAIKR